MSLISRVKRLWELSGTFSDAEDTKLAEKIKFHGEKKRKVKKQKLATILQPDPEEFFPAADENNNDTTSKQTPTD